MSSTINIEPDSVWKTISDREFIVIDPNPDEEPGYIKGRVTPFDEYEIIYLRRNLFEKGIVEPVDN